MTHRLGLQWGPGELRPAPFAPPVTIAPELKLTPPDFSLEGQFRQPNTERDIAGLRAAGAVAAAVLDEACKAVAPGVTTEEIDAVAHAACREPSTKPFPRCPAAAAASVLCHTAVSEQGWLYDRRAVLTRSLASLLLLDAVPSAALRPPLPPAAPPPPPPLVLAVSHGAWPTGLGFRGFPKSCCTSVNEVVCHGIPDSRPLEDGDLITIDCVAFLGMRHDALRYFCCRSAADWTVCC